MIPSYRKDSLKQHYRQLDKLGEGGMGTTYATEDVNTGKKVALKVISLQNQTEAKSLELLEREVTVLKQLNHPNIPKYIDYFQLEDDNKLYLVQELVSGKNLYQRVKDGLRLTEVEVKNIAKYILSILDYLHDFNPRIIHRDIKPHNLILSDDGQIFLVDFGAVHNAYYNTMMGGTVGIGTVGYMSPEQQMGRPVPASDLYSLGRTLLYLLTRRPPDHLLPHKEIVNVEVLRDYIQLSDEFIEWLEKILDPNVDERFSSAQEALKALKNPRLVKEGKLGKIRWFAWLSLGFASVAIATFSYNYRWAILNTLGFSAPLEICRENTIKITSEYLNSGGKLTRSDSHRCGMFLHTLIREDNKKILKLLINHGADLNAKSKSEATPLLLAIGEENKEIVELLLNNGADVNAGDKYKGTPLHNAVNRENKEIVELLLNNGADVNRFNALCYAAAEGYENIVKLLIAHGAKLNTWWVEPALHCAVKAGHKNIVELLIAHGADVNHRGNNRNVPVSYAARAGHKDIVKLLIANGANLNFRNLHGNKPLHFAEWGKNEDIINLLKQNGAR